MGSLQTSTPTESRSRTHRVSDPQQISAPSWEGVSWLCIESSVFISN